MTEQNQVDVTDGAYVNFASNLNTGRDKASHGMFQSTMIDDMEIEAVYQDWLAKKIINRPVQDMLRAGWYFNGIDEAKSLAMQDEIKRLKLVDRLHRALILMRKNGISYLLLGIADGKQLEEPCDLNTVQRGQFQFLTVLKKSDVSPITQGLNAYLPLEQTAGEQYKPAYYEIRQGNTRRKVHSSRLIQLKNGDEGESVLVSIYHTLRNFASVNAAAASLVHEAKIDVIKFPNLTTEIKTRAKELFERFGAAALMKSINGMLVIDKNEEYESKSYSFAGLPELMRANSHHAAAAADMPYVVVFNETTSGLNSSGEFDLRSYYDRINTDQHWLVMPLLNTLMPLTYRSLFGESPKGMGILFNSLWQMDAKTRAEVEKANAERDSKYVEMSIVTEAQVAKQLREDKVYDFIEDDHIADLESMVNRDETHTV